jgi:hypothetical protein
MARGFNAGPRLYHGEILQASCSDGVPQKNAPLEEAFWVFEILRAYEMKDFILP